MVSQHALVFAFGLIGNIISFMVYLSPIPTFIGIYKKKSTQGHHSIPYIAAIFSSMLWIYYALVKTNSMLLITINSFGVVVETVYIVIFLTYATRQAKKSTLKFLVLLNLGGFSSIILFCTYLVKTNAVRVQVLGWICVAFAVIVFAAPLSIMRSVIRTKSVEFMPFSLSLSLTMNAIAWGMYGLLKKDMYVVLPNVLGLLFSIAQMSLYLYYKNLGSTGTHGKQVELEVENIVKVPVAADLHDPPQNPTTKSATTGYNENDVTIEIPLAQATNRQQAAAHDRDHELDDDNHHASSSIKYGDEDDKDDANSLGQARPKYNSCKEEIININNGVATGGPSSSTTTVLVDVPHVHVAPPPSTMVAANLILIDQSTI